MHAKTVATRVLVLILFGAVGSACGQLPPGNGRAAVSPAAAWDEPASLPLVSPAIVELAAHPSLQAGAWDLRAAHRRARTEQQHRQALQETAQVIQRLASDPKHDLAVSLMSRKRITGRVLSADSSGFTIRARYSRQATTIRYDEVSEWSLKPKVSDQVLERTGFVLIGIVLLPLFLLAGVAGWDGC